MNRYVTLGLTALAGAALLETALIPGILIGGAAVLAPRLLPGFGPKPRRRERARASSLAPRRASTTARPKLEIKAARLIPGKLGVGQAVAKTITFRVIVTALDFTSNYVVLGEADTAAGLSAFALVVGPVLYFAHEAAWNYFGPAGNDVVIRLGGRRFVISRALAKTITFRAIATVIDFTTLYVVVGDVATAAGLSAFAFVIGPFVYYGHEWLWDRYSPSKTLDLTALPPPQKLLPESAPGLPI